MMGEGGDDGDSRSLWGRLSEPSSVNDQHFIFTMLTVSALSLGSYQGKPH